MTLVVAALAVNVALSPARTLSSLKLWKRFGPARVPSASSITKAGPVSAPAGPSVPSVTICADDGAAMPSAARVSSTIF